MTDSIHFVILLLSLASISGGLWMVYPPSMFIALGVILLCVVWSARQTEKQRHDSADRHGNK